MSSELSPAVTELFKSIDMGLELNLHEKYGGELEKLIKEKELDDKQKNFINNFHFSSMELRIFGKDPTIAYRRGIRAIPSIPIDINNTIEKILKLLKDDKFSEKSQLLLLIILVKMFLNKIHVTNDDFKQLIYNWCEEINNDDYKDNDKDQHMIMKKKLLEIV